MAILEAGQAVNKSTVFGSIFATIGIILFIIVIVAKPVAVLYTTHSFSAAGYTLGNEFLLSTKNLADESQKIIDNKTAYDFSGGFLKGLGRAFLQYSVLLSAIGAVFIWLKIFAWFASKTPLSYSDNFFINYTVAFFLFYIFQLVTLLVNAGIAHELDGIIGDNSLAYYAFLPIQCFWLFIQALPYIFAPVGEAATRVVDLENKSNFTLRP